MTSWQSRMHPSVPTFSPDGSSNSETSSHHHHHHYDYGTLPSTGGRALSEHHHTTTAEDAISLMPSRMLGQTNSRIPSRSSFRKDDNELQKLLNSMSSGEYSADGSGVQQQTNNKRVVRRKVTFVEQREIIPYASPLDSLQITEWNEIWYQAEDLESFRSEARALCLEMRDRHQKKQQQQQQQQQRGGGHHRGGSKGRAPACAPALAYDHQTRGLEQRTCLERQRRKYIGNKHILKAQNKLRAVPERLALLAQRCTNWAAKLAAEEAARDFVRAYSEGSTSLSSGSSQSCGVKRPAEDSSTPPATPTRHEARRRLSEEIHPSAIGIIGLMEDAATGAGE